MKNFNVPILVICKDRVRFLDTTLKSLSATIPDDTPVFISNDGTQNESMIKYLTTNNTISINESEYPNENASWLEYCGYVPNVKEVRGIIGKGSSMLWKENRGATNIHFIMDYIFNLLNPSAIIQVEDDVLFKEGWYEVMLEAIKTTPDAGIISGFRHFYRSDETKPFNDFLEEPLGCTGALLMALTRKFYEKVVPTILSYCYIMHHDDIWIEHCRYQSLRFLVTKKGLCQHIGFESSIYGDAKPFFIDNKVNLARIDPDITPPFSIASDVKQFAM